MIEDERAAAALVPPSAPSRVDCTLPVGENAHIGIIILCFFRSGEAEALYMTSREPDSQKRLGRVQSLGEELGAQRERAQVLEHGGRVCLSVCLSVF